MKFAPPNTLPKYINKKGKLKPPISAQILFALSFLSLIYGLLISSIMLLGSTRASVSSALLVLGISTTSIVITAIINLAISILYFTVIYLLRSGKLWALFIATAISAIGMFSSILEYFSSSSFEKFFNKGSTILEITAIAIVSLLLLDLSIRKYDYFK